MSRYLPWAMVGVIGLLTVAGRSMAASPFSGRLGVEASGDAFVDLAKQSYRWQKADGHGGWAALERSDVDAHGWPRSDSRWVFDARPCAEWTGQIDDPEAHRVDYSGVYHGSFHGKASLAVGGGSFVLGKAEYEPGTNRTVFTLTIPKPGPGHGLILLDFRDTQRDAGSPMQTGVADFKLIRPGYASDSQEIFTREYLACLRSAAFSTIRFMNVTNTNGNVEWGNDHTRTQPWSNRKLASDAAVEAIGPLNKKDGWPWEYATALCNEVGMDMWLDIPASADDDYIRQLAQLLKAQLEPTLNVYIEHSNEIWNFGFIQYAWNKARANEEVKAGTARYDFDHCGNDELWGQRRHAQRVKDAVDIFATVFGKSEINHRIRGVLAGVTADPDGFFVDGRLPGMLEYLQATGQPPKESIYAIAMPAYYGGKAASGEPGTESDKADQIIAGMEAGIRQAEKERMAAVQLARHFELPGGLCAYESGPDIGGGKVANIGSRIQAIRDPRQKALFETNLTEEFWGGGGNLAMQFTLSAPYGRFGAYGLTDDIATPDRNSLFQGVRELVGEKH